MSRIVVIGAGVGGLACAARLARLGHDVTVFEQADQVGGKLGRHTVRTAAGQFTFDTGPSLLTIPHLTTELLGDSLELVELDPIVRHYFSDGTRLDSCRDPRGFAMRINEAFGPAAADDWRRLWVRAGRIWAASWRDVLSVPRESVAHLARLGAHVGDLAAVAPGRTLRGLSRGTLRDRRLRMLVDRYATYAGADPRRAPAALLAIAYAELHHGGWYVPGGLARLADALMSACRDLGVSVYLGHPVTAVEAPAGRVCGVRLGDGSRRYADVVVVNADALTLYRELLPHPQRLSRLADRSLAGFALLLGVRGHTRGMAHHTVFYPKDYDAEFDAVFGDPGRGRPARPAADPTIYVTIANDPAVRPAGHEAWFVLVNAPTQSTVDWSVPGRSRRYAAQVLDVLARRGVDVRDRLLFCEVRTPADLADRAGAVGGAIYGTASHGLRGLVRPNNRGPVAGLFLVGGSAHPGGGLPMVMLGARIVAEQVGAAR